MYFFIFDVNKQTNNMIIQGNLFTLGFGVSVITALSFRALDVLYIGESKSVQLLLRTVVAMVVVCVVLLLCGSRVVSIAHSAEQVSASCLGDYAGYPLRVGPPPF